MIKAKKMTLVFAVVILLTACGRKADDTVTTEEIVVPELSSEDILVNSLEYLLQEDEEEEGIIQEQEEGIIQEQEVSADGRQAEEEAAGSVSLVLYYSNGSFDGLDSQTEKAEELTADALIAALARHNIVSLDTKVLSFREEEKEERKVLYLDLSAEMEDYLNTMSKKAKSIIINAITSTFLENYSADIIQITIDGKPLEVSEALKDM